MALRIEYTTSDIEFPTENRTNYHLLYYKYCVPLMKPICTCNIKSHCSCIQSDLLRNSYIID